MHTSTNKEDNGVLRQNSLSIFRIFSNISNYCNFIVIIYKDEGLLLKTLKYTQRKDDEYGVNKIVIFSVCESDQYFIFKSPLMYIGFLLSLEQKLLLLTSLSFLSDL